MQDILMTTFSAVSDKSFVKYDISLSVYPADYDKRCKLS